MQQTVPATLSSLYTAFDARYQGGYQRAAPWWNKIATEVASSTRSNTYHWAVLSGALREWIGERLVKHLAMRGHTIENKDWEYTLELERNDIDDFQLGLKAMEAENAGAAAAKWKDQMLVTLLKAAESTIAYDGQYFFDTDHPKNSDNTGAGTFANLVTSTPLTPDNFEAQMAAFSLQVDEGGEIMGLRATHLMIPPQLQSMGRRILSAEFVPSTAGTATQSNVNVGAAELLIIPELGYDATSWYLLDLSKPIKPFVVQTRKEPQFVVKDGPQDDEMFWHKRAVFGVDARGNVGFTLPFLARKMKA